MRAEGRREKFRKLRCELIEALGGKCARCGYDEDVRALQIDHVNSDGKIDRVKKGIAYYYLIRKNLASGRYQVLCANCNVIKRVEKQECPLKGRDGANPDRKE